MMHLELGLVFSREGSLVTEVCENWQRRQAYQADGDLPRGISPNKWIGNNADSMDRTEQDIQAPKVN